MKTLTSKVGNISGALMNPACAVACRKIRKPRIWLMASLRRLSACIVCEVAAAMVGAISSKTSIVVYCFYHVAPSTALTVTNLAPSMYALRQVQGCWQLPPFCLLAA